MKNLKQYIIIFILILVIAIPISNFAQVPTVTFSNSPPTSSSVTISGTVTDPTQSVWIDYGTDSFDLDQSENLSVDSFGNFTITLTGLSSDTTYFYVAYLPTEGYDIPDDVQSFITLPLQVLPEQMPTITVSHFAITETSANIYIEITTYGTSISNVNIIWGIIGTGQVFTDIIFEQTEQFIPAPPPQIPYDYTLEDLNPGTTYTYRIGYMPANVGIQYSEIKTFTTDSTPTGPPTVSNLSESSITENSAQISGTISGTIGTNPEFTLRVGKTADLPFTGQDKVTIEIPITATLGQFMKTISGLDTETMYYYEIYYEDDDTLEAITGTQSFTTGTPTTPPSTPPPTIPPPSDSMGRLVPCGGDTGDPCTFAHLMKLVHNIIRFLLFSVAMPVAAIAFVYAGFLFMFHGDNEAKRAQAKGIFLNVFFGLVIALAAWLIIDLILDTLLKPETMKQFRILEQ